MKKGKSQGESRPEGEGIWLLVFDLDGTLIDSSQDLCASVNAALMHVGRSPLPQHTITAFIGDGAATLMRRALRASETAEKAVVLHSDFERSFPFFLELYREHKLDTTRVYPGVLESLREIRKRNPALPMAVLTNKPVHPSREICAALGLAPFFFANYGGNSFATKKPHPEGLLKIMDEASALRAERGISPGRFSSRGVVMIGDSAADVLVGRACGTRTVGCSFGLDPGALQSTAPDHLVDSAWEWPEVLGL